jgi:hypothetical protein
VSWPAIIAGAFAMASVSLTLLALGSGLGLASVSPWYNSGPSATTFGVWAAVWLIVVQWLSAALGGYLTGRVRTKWVAVHCTWISPCSVVVNVGMMASSVVDWSEKGSPPCDGAPEFSLRNGAAVPILRCNARAGAAERTDRSQIQFARLGWQLHHFGHRITKDDPRRPTSARLPVHAQRQSGIW